MRVLVVEDSLFIREILVQACVEIGYVVVGEAGTGDQAIESARRLQPELILLDLVLPDKNGIQAAELIREENPEIVLVAITSLTDSFVVEKMKSIGFLSILTKPFTKMDLIQTLQKASPLQEGVKYG